MAPFRSKLPKAHLHGACDPELWETRRSGKPSNCCMHRGKGLLCYVSSPVHVAECATKNPCTTYWIPTEYAVYLSCPPCGNSMRFYRWGKSGTGRVICYQEKLIPIKCNRIFLKAAFRNRFPEPLFHEGLLHFSPPMLSDSSCILLDSVGFLVGEDPSTVILF